MTMTAEPTTIDAASIRLMTIDEARTCVTRIRDGLEDVLGLILQLHDREGWAALGYASWSACVEGEFSFSRSRSYQLLDLAHINRALSTIVDSAVPIPETHARELAPLKDDPEAVRQVYAEVRDVTGGKPTQKDMRAGVDRLLARSPRPAPKPSVIKSAAPEAEVCQDIPDELVTAGADVAPDHEFPFNNEAPIHAAKAEQWCHTCGEHGEHVCDEDDEPYPRGADIACSRCGGGILVNTPEMDRALARVVAEGRHSEILCLACPGADTVSWRRTVDVEPSASVSAPSNEVEEEEEEAPAAASPTAQPALHTHTSAALAVPARRSAISDPVPSRRTGADGGAMIFVESKAGPLTRALFSSATVVEVAQAIVEEAPPGELAAVIGLMAGRLDIDQAKALYRTLDTRIRLHNDRQTALHLKDKAS